MAQVGDTVEINDHEHIPDGTEAEVTGVYPDRGQDYHPIRVKWQDEDGAERDGRVKEEHINGNGQD